MNYVYHLSGENPDLAEREVKELLESQSTYSKLKRRNQILESEVKPKQPKRLSLVHEIGEKLGEVDKDDLDKYTPDFQPNESFSVRIEGANDEKEKLEKLFGEKFETEGNSVDLDNPETKIKGYRVGSKIVLCKILEDINRGLFDKRANQERPYSSPISLEPILARALVNLSGLKAGEHILDPFCGTGGILIEAGLCGIGVNGFDLQKEMVKGCRENLEEYGIISHAIKQLNISEAVEKGYSNFDAIVTDLPYGKSSKKTGEAVEYFLELLEDFEGRVVFMYNEDELGKYEADFSVYVHKNLTRYIYIV